jgi:hypothetical protein
MLKLRLATVRIDDDDNALDALAQLAKRTSDWILLLLEITGLVGALAILLWIPSRMGLSLPFIGLGMFGLWGITEHAKSGTHSLRAALSVFQLVLAGVGLLAIVALMFRLGGLAIGTVIS